MNEKKGMKYIMAATFIAASGFFGYHTSNSGASLQEARELNQKFSLKKTEDIKAYEKVSSDIETMVERYSAFPDSLDQFLLESKGLYAQKTQLEQKGVNLQLSRLENERASEESALMAESVNDASKAVGYGGAICLLGTVMSIIYARFHHKRRDEPDNISSKT